MRSVYSAIVPGLLQRQFHCELGCEQRQTAGICNAGTDWNDAWRTEKNERFGAAVSYDLCLCDREHRRSCLLLGDLCDLPHGIRHFLEVSPGGICHGNGGTVCFRAGHGGLSGAVCRER